MLPTFADRAALRAGQQCRQPVRLRGPPGTGLTRVELGPIAPIERAVAAWRDALGADAGGASARGVAVTLAPARDAAVAGEALRHVVLDPLHESLAGANRIIVALDDVLHLVALDALPAGETWRRSGQPVRPTPFCSGRYSRSSCARACSRCSTLRPPPQTGELLVAIGGVDYGGPDPQPATTPTPSRASTRAGILRGGGLGRRFRALPATGEEARGIAHLWRGLVREEGRIELLEGSAASRERLVALAPQASTLHVATHGWFAPDSVRSAEDPQPLDLQLGFGLSTGLEQRVRSMSPMLLCGSRSPARICPRTSWGAYRGW